MLQQLDVLQLDFLTWHAFLVGCRAWACMVDTCPRVVPQGHSWYALHVHLSSFGCYLSVVAEYASTEHWWKERRFRLTVWGFFVLGKLGVREPGCVLGVTGRSKSTSNSNICVRTASVSINTYLQQLLSVPSFCLLPQLCTWTSSSHRIRVSLSKPKSLLTNSAKGPFS